MTKQQNEEKYFNEILELQGVEEFKTMVQRLRTFRDNKEKYSIQDITLPNYLLSAKRGGGISTCVGLFAEYLYNAKIMEFTGIVKYFEYRLAYITPNLFFSELTRLNNTISEIAGHHRYYRGLACININEWIDHTNEKYFYKFLDYIASKNDKILTILYVNPGSKRVFESVESSLSSRIRFESITLRFPDTSELIEFIGTKYFEQKGFYFAEDAKSLLMESIDTIKNGEHFNGFTTIKQLANDILYNLFTSKIENKEIKAEVLSGFNKDSAYIKRIKTFVGTSNVIGFGSSAEGY